MADSSFDRELPVSLAKMAEKLERYDDMVGIIKEVAFNGEKLRIEERDLLFEGYKKAIRVRREVCQKLASLGLDKSIAKIYEKRVEEEISRIYRDAVSLIDEHLINPNEPADAISTVFYYRMKGDFHRNIAGMRLATKAYEDGLRLARTELNPTNPVKLVLALNYSAHCYIISSPQRGYEVAKESCDEALSELKALSALGDPLSKEEYKDSVKILQLLLNNRSVCETEMLFGISIGTIASI